MADENPEQSNSNVPDPTSRRSRNRGEQFIMIGVVAVLVVGALLFWWHSTFYEDTDDAQINGHLIQISSRIAGQVIKVNVEENQYVEKGAVLVEIDPKDFRSRRAAGRGESAERRGQL